MSEPAQLPLDFDHRPAYGGEDFLVADSNREAVQWIDRWPDWPSPALVVFGPPGCGKTHLAEVFRHHADAVLMDHGELAENRPRDPAAAGGAWVVEDADQFLAAYAPEPLFHLYNQVKEGGGGLFLTGRTPPSQWDFGLADLASRLKAAAAVSIGPPGDDLIAALLVKLFADRQLKVSADVIEYLLKRMERSFSAARKMVSAIDAAALAERREITVPLTRKVLESFTSAE